MPGPMSPAPAPSHAASPAWLLAVRAMLLTFAVFVVLGSVLQALHPPTGIWTSELLVFFGLSALLVTRSGRHPFRYPGLGWTGLGPLVVGFLLGTLNFFALVAPLQLMMQAIFPESWVQAFDGSRIFEGLAPWELWAVIGGVTLAAPFCEEYFFRGVLQQGLARRSGAQARALVITSVIFSLFHLDPVGFVGRLELGLLFGLLYLRTGSLWAPIGAHMANNAVSAALFLAGQGVEAPEANALPDPAAIAGIAGIGGIFFLALLWGIHISPALLPPRAMGPEVPLRPLPGAVKAWGLWAGAGLLALALGFFASKAGGARAPRPPTTDPLPAVIPVAPSPEAAPPDGLPQRKR